MIVESTPPEAGGDVHLTIRLDLQRRLYEMFERRLAATPDSPGGSIVVLDVESRECLALVSYPGFDPDTFRTNYRELRRDTRRQPLRFRAAANHYAPGSIVKPLICLAGLNSGKIDLDTRYTCAGALFPDHPDRWRCWAAAGTGQRMRHGSLDVPEAIKHSCNIFMYRTGQLAGVQELTNYFDMVGFGRTTGTGLIEEVSGINPTPSWLASVAGRTITPGKARHFAIGQAEVSITPLQAANLMAVYASGEYRRVALVRELAESATWKLPGEAAHWRAIRRGLWGVVNDVDGTAHSTACLEPGTGYALCGKTGSAEARPWPVSYEIPFVDAQGVESIAVQHATTRSGAVEDFVREHPDGAFDHREIGVHQRWPPGPPAPPSTSHSHAWFAGYLQAVDETGRPVAERRPRIAFAVMVEFGGSGGRVSAPIGKQVARICIEMLGPELDPDTLPDTPPREERQ